MKSNQSLAPIETTIPLLEPVRIYTAKELAVMRRSRMLACIEAQEAFYLMEHTTKMGGASNRDTPSTGRRCFAYSGQRKVQNALQGQWRVYRTSNHPPAGKAWLSKAGRC